VVVKLEGLANRLREYATVAQPKGTVKADAPIARSEPIDLITQAKAADLLRTSEKTIALRIKDGVIHKYSRSRVSKTEIEANRDMICERVSRSRSRRL